MTAAPRYQGPNLNLDRRLATEDEIQPIISGLADHEALLGDLIGGLVFVPAVWLIVRSRVFGRQSLASGQPHARGI